MRNFRPLRDLILVKPDPRPEKIGSLFVPGAALPQGHEPSQHPATFLGVEKLVGETTDGFTGIVVAVGPGDRHKPVGSFRCSQCGQKHLPFVREAKLGGELYSCGCLTWGPAAVARWNAGRYPMEIKVGDRVVYRRRPPSPVETDPGTGKCDLVVDGVEYLLFNESQSALAVLEPAVGELVRAGKLA